MSTSASRARRTAAAGRPKATRQVSASAQTNPQSARDRQRSTATRAYQLAKGIHTLASPGAVVVIHATNGLHYLFGSDALTAARSPRAKTEVHNTGYWEITGGKLVYDKVRVLTLDDAQYARVQAALTRNGHTVAIAQFNPAIRTPIEAAGARIQTIPGNAAKARVPKSRPSQLALKSLAKSARTSPATARYVRRFPVQSGVEAERRLANLKPTGRSRAAQAGPRAQVRVALDAAANSAAAKMTIPTARRYGRSIARLVATMQASRRSDRAIAARQILLLSNFLHRADRVGTRKNAYYAAAMRAAATRPRGI